MAPIKEVFIALFQLGSLCVSVGVALAYRQCFGFRVGQASKTPLPLGEGRVRVTLPGVQLALPHCIHRGPTRGRGRAHHQFCNDRPSKMCAFCNALASIRVELCKGSRWGAKMARTIHEFCTRCAAQFDPFATAPRSIIGRLATRDLRQVCFIWNFGALKRRSLWGSLFADDCRLAPRPRARSERRRQGCPAGSC